VVPVVEALEVVVVVVMVKGQPAYAQQEVSYTVKDEGKKKGSNLSEVFFVGAPGMVRVMGVGWLVCVYVPCDTCEGRCNGWLACPQGMMWQQL